ncbi:DUF1330 domain-containing protein [Primorskyibacter sp. S187A]|uniref:DUF1330 domain-containing protein n=1 Tax=Primorskyibacter sp. S187A TaxID=3415130 RepID=UPI003C7E32D3
MPKGYVIAHVHVEDPEAFRTYVQNNGPAIARHGGRVLIKNDDAEVVEGESYEVHVVIEFPSFDAAKAFYNDPVYQEVAKFRQGAGLNTLILVEGVPDA